jgi:hypothetical protein
MTDYCTATVDAAGAHEAGRQRDEGPWEERPTEADVRQEPEDEEEEGGQE